MIFTFMRILFLFVHCLPEYLSALSHTGAATIPGETAVHDLASSWCSAYRSSDPERLAAMETRETEIVDRFGEWHHVIGLKARVHFWDDGFGVVRRKDFRPACTVEHVRRIGRSKHSSQEGARR